MTIDISTPELFTAAVNRARNNKRHLLSLLKAMGACSRRRQLATVGLETAFRRASIEDLRWYLRHAEARASGNEIMFGRYDKVCESIAVNSGLPTRAERRRFRANLIRTFYTMYGTRKMQMPVIS